MTERPEPQSEDCPTGDQLVTQIGESDQRDSGPNPVLRQHIEMFSKSGPVFQSLAKTILGAIYAPALLAFLALQLTPAYEASSLQGAVYRGLTSLCLPVFFCLFLIRALQPGGLAVSHFNWSTTLCHGLKTTLKMMLWVWLPLRFIYTGLETYDDGKFNDSMGRILFIIAMVAFSLALWRSIQCLRKWLAESEETKPWYGGFRSVMVWLLPLMPTTLAVLSALGYHFTAVEMSWRALWTVLLTVGISMLGGMISRLLLIAQFGIKLRQLKRNDDGEIDRDETIDIGAISAQVNRLLSATALITIVIVGWQIWGNVLPAIGYLDSVQIGNYVLSEDGLTKEYITLRHCLMAIGTVIITFVLSRNLPGLLEITVLDRLPLDRGGRYAISFVLRYLVGIVGTFAACQLVGFSWSSVQWLAAGLTVGLGFGLQEIFANIVSGIIILIERPVRVGDVVTVNGTTGTVTRMALRATTIKDYDYRELIVPNKKFITEDLMNWTLTDRKSRLIFNVGVAYGSDTKLVYDTLIKVANRHPLVNEDPAPRVVLTEFADSSLNFELQVVIPTRDIFPKVKHELNMAIESEFAAKSIEIAFPQQDIFIKNLGDLPVGGSADGPSGGSPMPGTAPSLESDGTRGYDDTTVAEQKEQEADKTQNPAAADTTITPKVFELSDQRQGSRRDEVRLPDQRDAG